MDLSIIIVSFNTKDLTLNCIRSIEEHIGATIDFEIVVVDNNSRDGSQAALKSLCAQKPNCRLIEADANLGFAKANNIGIKRATGKFVLLLNSDTYLIDNSMLDALEYLRKHEKIFGCGCTLLNADHSVGISYGAFPELGTLCKELIFGCYGQFRAVVPKKRTAIYTIDFPCGAFFLIRRNLLDAVGLLDEGFFMYCEETDLAKRAWKAGYAVVYYGPATVVHLRGQSASPNVVKPLPGEETANLNKTLYQSWKRYLLKHCSPLQAALVGFLVSLYFNAYRLFFALTRNAAAMRDYEKELRDLQSGWYAPVTPF